MTPEEVEILRNRIEDLKGEIRARHDTISMDGADVGRKQDGYSDWRFH